MGYNYNYYYYKVGERGRKNSNGPPFNGVSKGYTIRATIRI